jgi:hypothetical protein
VRRPRSRHVALLFAVVGVASLLVAGLLVRARSEYERDRAVALQGVARQQAKDAADTIDRLLVDVQDAGNNLLERLNSGEVSSANAQVATKALLEKFPNLWGVGITYDRRLPNVPAEPNVYTTRPGGVIKPGKITYNYEDPADPRGHWWRRAIDVGSTWVPPYLGGTTKKMVAVYTGRFFGPGAPADGRPAGAIIISIQLDTINRSVVWSELGSSGYGFVLSRSGSYLEHPSRGVDGVFVSHPRKAYWRGADAPSFSGVAARNGNGTAVAILGEEGAAPGSVIDYQDELTGKDAWLFHERIPSADWVLGFVVIRDVVIAGDRTLFHYGIGIGMAAINGLTCLLIAFAALVLRRNARIWVITTVLTVTPLFGIGMIWRMVLADNWSAPPPGTAAMSSVDGATGDAGDGRMSRYSDSIEAYEKYVASVSGDLRPTTVLAGMFVQWAGPNELLGEAWKVTGVVWQRYANGVPEGGEPGFVFPDAVDEPVFDPIYDVQDGDTRTLGWRFTVSVQPQRQLGKFPLDEMDLTIRMAHREVDRPIVLLPDVGEYDLVVPIARPGLAPEVGPDGFTVVDSRFGYATTAINTTLGVPNFARQSEFPELTFTVHLKRQFIDPFVSQTMPLVVVMLLLFTVHVMATRPAEWTMVTRPPDVPKGMRARLWGSTVPGADPLVDDGIDDPSHANFYVQATLTSVLALMFVTILSHNSMRGSIGAPQIVYLEYAYFVLYAALLLVAVNSLLFATGRGGWFVHWRRNLLPELLYWPGVMALLFLATLRVFW